MRMQHIVTTLISQLMSSYEARKLLRLLMNQNNCATLNLIPFSASISGSLSKDYK